jgi:hypothetical protein
LRSDDWLPPHSGKAVAGVRLDMRERGFTLVRTPWLFDHDLLRRLRRSKEVLPCHAKGWRKHPHLVRYAHWLECLLRRALPEESLCLMRQEHRHEPAGYVDREVDTLHADGSYVRSVFTLYGMSTIYRDGRAELPVPGGHTLLLTAMYRARAVGLPCTLHRRPGAGPERAVIVCSFEPSPEAPANVTGRDRRSFRSLVAG